MNEQEIRIIYNEKSGTWVKTPEPYMTLEIATEEDWKTLQATIAFYNEHHKENRQIR